MVAQKPTSASALSKKLPAHYGCSIPTSTPSFSKIHPAQPRSVKTGLHTIGHCQPAPPWLLKNQPAHPRSVKTSQHTMVAQKPASTPWFTKNQPPHPGSSKTSHHAQVTRDRKIAKFLFTFFSPPPGGKSHTPDSNFNIPKSNFDLVLQFFFVYTPLTPIRIAGCIVLSAFAGGPRRGPNNDLC